MNNKLKKELDEPDEMLVSLTATGLDLDKTLKKMDKIVTKKTTFKYGIAYQFSSINKIIELIDEEMKRND